jgi:hypothetical protein
MTNIYKFKKHDFVYSDLSSKPSPVISFLEYNVNNYDNNNYDNNITNYDNNITNYDNNITNYDTNNNDTNKYLISIDEYNGDYIWCDVIKHNVKNAVISSEEKLSILANFGDFFYDCHKLLYQEIIIELLNIYLT